MKITPNNALFTAISQFPDPSQVRARRAQAGAQQPTQQSAAKTGDPRAALIRDALRQAALNQANQHQAKQTDQDRPQAAPVKATAKSAEVQAPAPTDAPLQTYAAGSVRREAPLAEARPAFVRLGQFVDLKV